MENIENILTIDDDEHILQLYKELLEYIGYKVYTANNGQDGLDIYVEKKDKIDLVILDMIMPGLSGGDTFDKFREINPNVKIVLSSGCSINEDVTKIINRGCNGFIQKPFSMEEFFQKIREILDG